MRTRFAPSPSGSLHAGNARTALFAWLAARRVGGRFVLRIEDSDAARSSAAAEAAILADLHWLGLDWDEGPDVGGDFGPYRQSERAALHTECLQRLREAGRLYPCFCSPGTLAASRASQRAAGRPPRYAGTCAALPAGEAAARVAAGEPHSLRFAVEPGAMPAFDDRVRGPQRFAAADIGDFVVRRADGTAAFFFCNAVDDALMGVTDVFRGEDHLANTARQLMVLEALDMPAPRYAHLPLVVDAAGRPLSKREGAPPLADYRRSGILGTALMNTLARLGHSYEQTGLLSAADLALQFEPGHIGRAAARLDPAQVLHWQREALAACETDSLWTWMGAPVHALVPPEDAAAFVETVRANLSAPDEALAWARRLFEAGQPPEADAGAAMAEAGEAYYTAALALLEPPPEDFRAYCKRLAQHTGRRGRALYAPLRAALTGRLDGPELAALWRLLGSARLRQRLEYARCVASHRPPEDQP